MAIFGLKTYFKKFFLGYSDPPIKVVVGLKHFKDHRNAIKEINLEKLSEEEKNLLQRENKYIFYFCPD